MTFRQLILTFCLFLCTELLYAQVLTFEKLFSVGIHITKTEYSGDLGNSIWNVNAGQTGSYWFYWGGGASFSVNLNASFFVSLDANYGTYGFFEDPSKHKPFTYKDNNFLSNKLDFTTTAHYKLNNGYIFKEEAIVAPFLSLGVGVAKYFYHKRDEKYAEIYDMPHRLGDQRSADFIVPFGGGIQFNVSKDLAVRYQYLWNFTSSDAHDIISDLDGRNDIFGQHMASIIFSFGNVDRKKISKPYSTRKFISF